MKAYILAMLVFYICPVCFAQEHEHKDSIQICYHIGAGGIGGQDHCIIIWFEKDLIFCQRICYSIFSDMRKYMIDTELSTYEETKKQAILYHYQENRKYLILNERVEISKSQFDELIKIINEIKVYESEETIISTTGGIHYMIKDKNGTTAIVDYSGRYNRRGDIEKVLGLKSYLRCPCVEEDLKQINNSRDLVGVGRRLFRRSPQ